MEATAKLRHLKGSPRKARLVIDLIRGRNVSQALNILKFTDKRAADPIAKTLRSAIANATFAAEKQNIAIDPDDLFVKTCFVDMGAHKNRRRMRPAPQGRAYREQRHYCHITIEVSSDQPTEEKKITQKKGGKEGDKSSGEKPVKTANTKQTKVAGEVKETKKAKKEDTPIEETTAPITDNAPKAEKTAKNTAEETVKEEAAKNEAEVSDAKNATTQTTAEQNESKPADEAQLDRNEELEKQ